EDDRTGLAGVSAAGGVDHHVDFAICAGLLKDVEHVLAIALLGEVGLHRPIVHQELAIARANAHAGHSGLAAAGAPPPVALGGLHRRAANRSRSRSMSYSFGPGSWSGDSVFVGHHGVRSPAFEGTLW